MNLKEQRAVKVARQQFLVNAAKQDKRSLTTEEQTEFDSLQAEIEDLSRQIEEDEQANQSRSNTEEAVRAERERISSINTICRQFGMESDTYVSNNSTVDQVRAAALDHVLQNGAPLSTSGIDVTASEEDKRRGAIVDSLLMRGGLTLEKPAEGANNFRSMSFRDIAIDCLAKEGMSDAHTKSSDDLFAELRRSYYNPTSAFPAIMDNAIEKAYKEGHKTVAVTFDQWTKKGTLKDFKVHDNYYLSGPAGDFLEVPEGGELKHDVYGDEKLPTRKLKTYGRQFTLTREAFINDDIDLVTRMPAKYAASARKTINKQVYSIMVKNPAIYDGQPLFGSGHKNVLATGTGITKNAMQAMIMALQTQKDQFGEACIIRPAIILVPSGYAFDMYTLFFSPTIETSGNTQSVNPLYRYKDQIQVIEDPTINVMCGGFGNTMPWWLLGAKEDTDFIEIDYLNGQEIPTIRRSEQAGTLGFTWDIYLDWGITVMDYRGAIKNPGIPVTSPLDLA